MSGPYREPQKDGTECIPLTISHKDYGIGVRNVRNTPSPCGDIIFNPKNEVREFRKQSLFVIRSCRDGCAQKMALVVRILSQPIIFKNEISQFFWRIEG